MFFLNSFNRSQISKCELYKVVHELIKEQQHLHHVLQKEKRSPKHFSTNLRMYVFPHKTPDSVNLKGSMTIWIHSPSQLAYPPDDWHHILLEMLLLSVTSLFIVPCILFASVQTLISLPHSPFFSVQVSSVTRSYSSSFMSILSFLCCLSLIFPPGVLMSILADAAHQHPAMKHFITLNTTYQFT